MKAMEQVSPVNSPVWASEVDGSLSDSCIRQGRIGGRDLSHGWYSWAEALSVAAAELSNCGEVESVRVALSDGTQTVRQFLYERFGVVTGRRESWHRKDVAADEADLREFIGALREAKVKRTARGGAVMLRRLLIGSPARGGLSHS